MTKNKFTHVDLENSLYDLAAKVTQKNGDTKKTNSAVGAYRAILQSKAIQIKAKLAGMNLDSDTSKATKK